MKDAVVPKLHKELFIFIKTLFTLGSFQTVNSCTSEVIIGRQLSLAQTCPTCQPVRSLKILILYRDVASEGSMVSQWIIHTAPQQNPPAPGHITQTDKNAFRPILQCVLRVFHNVFLINLLFFCSNKPKCLQEMDPSAGQGLLKEHVSDMVIIGELDAVSEKRCNLMM